MKKAFVILSLVLGLSVSSYAQLFNRDGEALREGQKGGGFPGLPGHGETDNQDAPLGGGALLLISFGAAYALSKKNKD
ncbi:MAG: hypothetical protein J6X40_01185 [Bacteroidales bacterium]|nr:hypothetical protein [Bacteroidales bacterium]